MILMLLCHLLGDWVFQPRKMAVKKGAHTISGWGYCLLHVSIYTGLFFVIPGQSVWFYLSIFVPHFIIDKFSLMSYWQRLRDGQYWWQSYQHRPEEFSDRVEAGFSALRYAVEDNTVHLVCLYFSYKYLFQ